MKIRRKVKYFDSPRQVKWYDYESGDYATGIAFQDFIICSCCGGIISIKEVYAGAKEDNVQGIFIYKSWESLSDSISSGESLEFELEAGYFEN